MAAPAPERGTLTCTRAHPQWPYESADGSTAQAVSSGNPKSREKTPLTPQLHGSRFCIGQSTKEPQGSTGPAAQGVCYSIKSTYFLSISTGFNKRCDLFWDRWSHLHNFHQLSGLRNSHLGEFVCFWNSVWNSVGRLSKFTFVTVVGPSELS